jgi:16S rRNA (cytosine1402-N4)-methyltransferase
LKASSPQGRLLGLDLDPRALALAGERLQEFGDRAVLRQASYRSLAEQVKQLDWPPLQGILLDLGLSSMQLDTPERGFSFQQDGPLDMRFGPANPVKASDLVNDLPETELADLLWRFGEESNSRRIARAIVRSRPLATTRQLAEVIAHAVPNRGKIHPATKSFQALRIAVNQELRTIEETLPIAVEALAPGGRLAVISFHSLEDRIVKQYFRRESKDCICPPEQIICTCGHRASIIEITRHPVQPGESEAEQNPRARSARLRVGEKRELA